MVNKINGAEHMKREQKNQQTRMKILTSAIKEFAQHGYEAGSLNTISQAGGISKGIIYHYFDSKDDLYLSCIETCFRNLTAYLSEHLANHNGEKPIEQIMHYFDIRMDFFRQQPDFARLFCEAVVMPPTELKQAICDRKSDFDQFNQKLLRHMLKQEALRPDVTEEELRRIFQQYEDFLNASYHTNGLIDIEQHEQDCRKALDIFFYGIIVRK